MGLDLSPLSMGAWEFLGLAIAINLNSLVFFMNEVIRLTAISFFLCARVCEDGLEDRLAVQQGTLGAIDHDKFGTLGAIDHDKFGGRDEEKFKGRWSQWIIVEAATNLLDSRLQYNTEPVSATILLLQRISELADGRKALVELEMDNNRENKNGKKTLIWALIVLFCKQSNYRQNIVMIMLAYTNSKQGARILISNQLDNILVSMVHSETDNSIKEMSVDILCSLASLNDVRCLRNFRSSPEAAAEFIKTLKREGSVKIKRMADYLAGKVTEAFLNKQTSF